MRAVAQRVHLLWGWRRALIAVMAGAAGALAMPPVSILPALALSLPVAVWLLDGVALGRPRLSVMTLRSAFAIGWLFGFGYFLAGLWWLGAAFLVETDEFAWLLPFGVLGLPAVLAIFHGVAFALARALWSGGPHRILALAVALAVTEFLRGIVFTGFPWNVYGQAFGASLWTMQAAAVVGVEGLTFLAVAIFATPALLGTAETPAARWRPVAVAVLALAALVGYGAVRLSGAAQSPVPGVALRIMQPNIAQREKNRPRAGAAILQRYLTLSDRATGPTTSGLSDVTHLFWPESPFPFLLAREPQALASIAAALKPGGTVLVTGAARSNGETGSSARYYNAINVIAPDGTIVDGYDKVHLVPFGEYLPFQAFFAAIGLRQFVNVPGGFDAGAARRPLRAVGLPPMAPLICYEAIFPGEVDSGAGRAGLLVNVTNDAWFGQTFGPYQHFEQARMRAVEQGLPLVRAANTGISAVVDPFGRVVASLPLGVDGVIDSRLPSAVAATVYATLGRVPMAMLLLIGLVYASRGLSRGRPIL